MRLWNFDDKGGSVCVKVKGFNSKGKKTGLLGPGRARPEQGLRGAPLEALITV